MVKRRVRSWQLAAGTGIALALTASAAQEEQPPQKPLSAEWLSVRVQIHVGLKPG